MWEFLIFKCLSAEFYVFKVVYSPACKLSNLFFFFVCHPLGYVWNVMWNLIIFQCLSGICMCSRLCILLPSGCLNCSPYFWCLPLGHIWNVIQNLLILQSFSAENLYVVKVVQGLCIQTPLASLMCCKTTPCERHPNWRWTLNQPHPIPRGKDRYINLLWLFKEQFALADALWFPLVLIDLYPLVLSFLILACPHWSVFGDCFLSLSSQCSFLSL